MSFFSFCNSEGNRLLLFYIKGLKVMDILVETSVIFFIILCESFVLLILMIGVCVVARDCFIVVTPLL